MKPVDHIPLTISASVGQGKYDFYPVQINAWTDCWRFGSCWILVYQVKIPCTKRDSNLGHFAILAQLVTNYTNKMTFHSWGRSSGVGFQVHVQEELTSFENKQKTATSRFTR